MGTAAVERSTSLIAPFGRSDGFPISGVRPPLAWTAGDEGEAQCGVVNRAGHRAPITPNVDRTLRALIWRVPHEGMLEYWEFAHVERSRVSGVLAVSEGAVTPVAPWDERCQESAHLRGLVEHYRLARLITGCGLGLPGPGSRFYSWARALYRKSGEPSYEAETVELIRTVSEQSEHPDMDELTRFIRTEWVGQFGEVPSSVQAGLEEASQLRLKFKGPIRREGRAQITRRARSSLEFRR